MNSERPPSNGDDASVDKTTLAALKRKLAAFSEAWDASPPEPDLAHFLPKSDDSIPRRLALVELIKIDMMRRYQSGDNQATVESYVDRWPELTDSQHPFPVDLIFEAIQIRRRDGQEVDPTVYHEKFPSATAGLKRMLRTTHSINPTTTLNTDAIRTHFSAGDRIDDFDLLVKLGQGGFASVFLARQRSMQRLVALKISADQGTEPQTLAQLDHPNIVRVFDQRLVAEEKVRLMYMQYVPGGTLYDVIRFVKGFPRQDWNGKLLLRAIDKIIQDRGESVDDESESRKAIAECDWPQAVCKIGIQLADALNYASQQGVLHRDLKPANVLMTAQGVPKLVDFNVSFCANLDGVSPSSFFGGSMAYMSPEQLRASNPEDEHEPEALDHRSDLFSLGVVLFELLTGRRPFGAEPIQSSWTATLKKMVETRESNSRTLDSNDVDCPDIVFQSIDTSLQGEPRKRQSTGLHLARQLHWGLDRETEAMMSQATHDRSNRLTIYPFFLVAALVVLINMLPTWFVTAYNQAEAIPNVDTHDFLEVRRWVNLVAFPVGVLMIGGLTWPIAHCIYRLRNKTEPTPQQLLRASRRNVALGFWVGILCAAEWTLAGILYPTIFHFSSLVISWRNAVDFIGSHFLAGILTASYAFFVVTYFALRFWQPWLARASLDANDADGGCPLYPKLLLAIPFFQALAASVPMAAMVALVVWGAAENKFALTVLSISGLVGFALMFWLSRKIQAMVGVCQNAFCQESIRT